MPVENLTVLDEANVRGVLAEATPADEEVVLADEADAGRADAALAGALAIVAGTSVPDRRHTADGQGEVVERRAWRQGEGREQRASMAIKSLQREVDRGREGRREGKKGLAWRSRKGQASQTAQRKARVAGEAAEAQEGHCDVASPRRRLRAHSRPHPVRPGTKPSPSGRTRTSRSRSARENEPKRRPGPLSSVGRAGPWRALRGGRRPLGQFSAAWPRKRNTLVSAGAVSPG